MERCAFCNVFAKDWLLTVVNHYPFQSFWRSALCMRGASSNKKVEKGCRFCISKEIALVNVPLKGWKCHHSVTLNLILSNLPWWQLSKYYRSNWLLAHSSHYQEKLISILQTAFLLFDNNLEITSWQPDRILVADVTRLYFVLCTSAEFLPIKKWLLAKFSLLKIPFEKLLSLF